MVLGHSLLTLTAEERIKLELSWDQSLSAALGQLGIMHPILKKYLCSCLFYKHMQSAYRLLAVSLPLPVQTRSECSTVSDEVHACYSIVYIRVLRNIPYPFLMITHMAVMQLPVPLV